MGEEYYCYCIQGVLRSYRYDEKKMDRSCQEMKSNCYTDMVGKALLHRYRVSKFQVFYVTFFLLSSRP